MPRKQHEVTRTPSGETFNLKGGTPVAPQRCAREIRQEMENDHRNELKRSRQEGANQFPIEVINEKARVYANESIRRALAEQNR